jgi:hypothetical protein
MLVKATQRGFFVKLRNPGDQFDVPDDAFSTKWMKRVEAAAKPEETPVPVEAPETTEAVAIGDATDHPSESPAAAAPVVKKRRGRPPKAVSE